MKKNLFEPCSVPDGEEDFQELISGGTFQLQRIVSLGHSTPPCKWYDQSSHEWVVLLKGAAMIEFENELERVELTVGDYLFIPAHQRHRVVWTLPGAPSVWLALHFDSQ